MTEHDRFDDYAAESAGLGEPSHRYHQLHQKDDEITHLANGIKTLKATAEQLN